MGNLSAYSTYIAVSLGADGARVSLRDDGKPFNPTAYATSPDPDGLAYAGIQVIRKISSRMEYSYALGFNNALVWIPLLPAREG